MGRLVSAMLARLMKAISDIPGPPPANSVPSAWRLFKQVRGDLLGTLERAFAEFGDVFRLEVFGRTQLFVRSPAMIREVLVDHADCFQKGPDYTDRRKGLARFAGNGLVTSNGEFWKRQRRIVAPAFHSRSVGGYLDTMVALTTRTLEGWKDGQSLQLDDEMMALTLHLVGRTLFSTDVHDDVERIAGAMEVIHGMIEANNSPATLLPGWFPTPQRWRETRAVQTLDEIMYRLIRQRRPTPDAPVQDTGDLTSMLLRAEDEAGARMTDVQARDELVTIFLAGHETTANALSWAWLLIAQHPEVEARLHAEVDEVLGGRAPTLEDLKKLPWVDAIARETLRLFPPIFTFLRNCIKETTLGEYALTPGVDVSVVPWATHRDARYFSDPLVFQPERFLGERKDSIERYAYVPFGAGPRICVGNAFSMMELSVTIALIASRFRLIPEARSQGALLGLVPPEPGLTLRPRGPLPVRLQARAPGVPAPPA